LAHHDTSAVVHTDIIQTFSDESLEAE